MSQPSASKVYIVGAGPGDPGLVALRAAQCLSRAQVVLYDYLVNPRILAHAPAGAQLVCLGRHGCDYVWRQDEINRRLVELAAAGQTVVRLKGGDPGMFGHLVEEVAALRAAGIPYEIVPGITAASAVASHGGVPLTGRDTASAVAFITGRESDDKDQPLDFRRLAQFPGTLVLYMGVTTVRRWATALLSAGMNGETPVAIVRRASFADQHVLRTRLANLPDEVERIRLRPPAVFVVGPTAANSFDLDWTARRPLSGVTVLAARAAQGDDPLAFCLAEQGARVITAPAIEITPAVDCAALDRAIERLPQIDWLVFSSSNGVQAFCDHLLASGRDLRALGSTRLAAIGPGTADALRRYHLAADLVPPEFRAESLADALAPLATGRRCLLVRASRGRETLAERLRAGGAEVEQVVAYTSSDVPAADPEAQRLLAGGEIDWIAVTSSAIARSLVRLFGPDLAQAKLASISPVTSEALAELGHRPTVEAESYTFAGLVAAIETWHGSHA